MADMQLPTAATVGSGGNVLGIGLERQTNTATYAPSQARPSINDLVFRRAVRDVHRLGERALAELLIALDVDSDDLMGKLRRFATIDPATLNATDGSRAPATDTPLQNCIRSGGATFEMIMRTSLDRAGNGGVA